MIEDRFVASLLALGGWLSRVGGRLMAPLGLTQQESVILLAVADRGPMRQRDLRSDLLLERSNVSKAVIHLESMGQLATAPAPEDARAVLVRATPAGQELAARCATAYQEWNHRWLDGADPAYLERTAPWLEELRRHDPQGQR